MKVLKEYLVTVYEYDVFGVRLGAYTLYGESYDEVFNKANTRLNTNEVCTFTYKGESVFEDWMMV